MAIVKNIEYNTSGAHRGKTDSASYPVDDSLTSGIEICQLIALKGDGTSEKFWDTNSGSGPTLILADNTDDTKPAVGIVYDTSGHYQYDGFTTDEQRYLLPFGTKNENKGLGLLKDVVVDVEDNSTGGAVYQGVQQTLTGAWSVDTGVNAKKITEDTTSGAATTELEVGDYVKIDGEVRQVVTITDDDEILVGSDFDSDKSGETMYQDVDLEKPIYLGTNGDFVKLKPSSGRIQVVGRIVSSNQVKIDLETVEY